MNHPTNLYVSSRLTFGVCEIEAFSRLSCFNVDIWTKTLLIKVITHVNYSKIILFLFFDRFLMFLSFFKKILKILFYELFCVNVKAV